MRHGEAMVEGGAESYNVTLEHVERERNYCSVAHELKVPFTAVDANCSKCSRARESRLVRLSKECKHEQHGRRVVAISFYPHNRVRVVVLLWS